MTEPTGLHNHRLTHLNPFNEFAYNVSGQGFDFRICSDKPHKSLNVLCFFFRSFEHGPKLVQSCIQFCLLSFVFFEHLGESLSTEFAANLILVNLGDDVVELPNAGFGFGAFCFRFAHTFFSLLPRLPADQFNKVGFAILCQGEHTLDVGEHKALGDLFAD